MRCTAQSWVERCLTDAMLLCPKYSGMHLAHFILAWQSTQKHPCRDLAAQWCGGNYWRACT